MYLSLIIFENLRKWVNLAKQGLYYLKRGKYLALSDTVHFPYFGNLPVFIGNNYCVTLVKLSLHYMIHNFLYISRFHNNLLLCCVRYFSTKN